MASLSEIKCAVILGAIKDPKQASSNPTTQPPSVLAGFSAYQAKITALQNSQLPSTCVAIGWFVVSEQVSALSSFNPSACQKFLPSGTTSFNVSGLCVENCPSPIIKSNAPFEVKVYSPGAAFVISATDVDLNNRSSGGPFCVPQSLTANTMGIWTVEIHHFLYSGPYRPSGYSPKTLVNTQGDNENFLHINVKGEAIQLVCPTNSDFSLASDVPQTESCLPANTPINFTISSSVARIASATATVTVTPPTGSASTQSLNISSLPTQFQQTFSQAGVHVITVVIIVPGCPTPVVLNKTVTVCATVCPQMNSNSVVIKANNKVIDPTKECVKAGDDIEIAVSISGVPTTGAIVSINYFGAANPGTNPTSKNVVTNGVVTFKAKMTSAPTQPFTVTLNAVNSPSCQLVSLNIAVKLCGGGSTGTGGTGTGGTGTGGTGTGGTGTGGGGGNGFGCFGGTFLSVLGAAFALFAASLLLCIPEAWQYIVVMVLGGVVVGAIGEVISHFFCKEATCSPNLLKAWLILLTAAILALSFGNCCQNLLIAGLGFLVAGLGLMVKWMIDCKITSCEALARVGQGFVSGGIINYLMGVFDLSAVLSKFCPSNPPIAEFLITMIQFLRDHGVKIAGFVLVTLLAKCVIDKVSKNP